MIDHGIIIFLTGLAALICIIWRSWVQRENSAPKKYPEFLIAIYLIAQGLLCMAETVWRPGILYGNNAPVLLLLLPAVMSIAQRKIAGKDETSQTVLWFSVGMVLSVYFIFINSNLYQSTPYSISASIFAILFLAVALASFGGIYRFLIGLAAITWAIFLFPAPHLGIMATGILMGTIIFSTTIQSEMLKSRGVFDFDIDEFINAIPSPSLILDLSGRIIYANQEFYKFAGVEKSAIYRSEAIELFEIPPDWRFKLQPSEAYKKIRCYFKSKGNDKVPVSLALSELRNNKQRLCNLLCEIQEEKEKELLEKRLKNEAVRFAGLYETSLVLSSSLEITDVLRAIANAAESLTKSDTCTIFLLDHAKQVLNPFYSTEESFNLEVMNFALPVGQGLTGSVVLEGKPGIQNYDDARKIAVQVPGTTVEVESLLSVPLIAKDTVIGALTLYKIGRKRFEEDDQKILTVFASQASAIIETSRLYMKLKASEKLYRYSVDLTGDMVFFVDPETGKITDFNDTGLNQLKYSRTDLASMYIWEIHPEPQMHIAKSLWEEVKKTGRCKLDEIDYLTKEGMKIAASVNVSMIFTGEISSIQWIARNIGDQKKALEQAGFLQSIFDRLDEPIFITDIKGKTLYANNAFCSIFNIDREYLFTHYIYALETVSRSTAILEEYLAKLDGQHQVLGQITIGHETAGGEITKNISILPYIGDQGTAKYYVWSFYTPPNSVQLEKTPEFIAN